MKSCSGYWMPLFIQNNGEKRNKKSLYYIHIFLVPFWELILSLDWEDPPEKGTATNSSILAFWELIPGLRRSPGEGNSYPLQYSGLENSVDRGAWQTKSLGSQRVRCDWAAFTFTCELSEWTDSFGPELAWSANITSSKDTLNNVYYLFAPVFFLWK